MMGEPDSARLTKTQGVEGNTKTSTRSRGWCYTWNNYTEADRLAMVEWQTQQTQCFVMGLEVGESGTAHLQGYVYLKNQRTFDQMKAKWGKVHWEKAKGNPKQNRNYCTKDGNYVEGGWKADPVDMANARNIRARARYEGVVWKDWQASLIEFVASAPDDRTVKWIYDEDGGQGKSYLAKYLYLNYPTIIADGKKDNVFNQLKTKLDEGVEPRLILLDIPRCGEGYMNYGVIEQLKNGMVYSGKYEGGDCIFDPPHVIVMANFEPDYCQFTEDRWSVVELGKKEEMT
nr:MAG: replication associated protein [Cressdnaviricota sp.]